MARHRMDFTELLALDLVNTLRIVRGREVDLIETVEQLTAWASERTHNAERAGISATAMRRVDLRTVRQVRSDTREVLISLGAGERPNHAALRRLEQTWKRCSEEVSLVWDGGALHRRSRRSGPSSEHVAGWLAQAAARLLTGEAASSIRQCQAPGCRMLLVSDVPGKVWCSPSCGNRARVARHYKRHRPGGPADDAAHLDRMNPRE